MSQQEVIICELCLSFLRCRKSAKSRRFDLANLSTLLGSESTALKISLDYVRMENNGMPSPIGSLRLM